MFAQAQAIIGSSSGEVDLYICRVFVNAMSLTPHPFIHRIFY